MDKCSRCHKDVLSRSGCECESRRCILSHRLAIIFNTAANRVPGNGGGVDCRHDPYEEYDGYGGYDCARYIMDHLS